VVSVDFDAGAKLLTVLIDFKPGSRFAVSNQEGVHPVHDTVTKTYRHLNFFQHECHLQLRTPRVTLPNGSVRLIEPDFAGRLSGFTLLFEAMILMLAQQMPFAAVARIVGESAHRVTAVCERYVEMALARADFSEVKALAIEELAADLEVHGWPPKQIEFVSIDMSPAFIKGVTENLPNARITFDKFHVVWHASTAVDKMRRRMTTVRTARAWLYKEQLREILARKQINVVRGMLEHWCTCVMRSKVGPMKEVAALVRRHMEGIVAWAQTRQTNGFLEALNGLFQAAKRRARGFSRLSTIRMVIFLIAGKLDFHAINPHARQPT